MGPKIIKININKKAAAESVKIIIILMAIIVVTEMIENKIKEIKTINKAIIKKISKSNTKII